ncbi:unnamed protein product [Didymodactylos carnosus]|uniref:Uncharacterized protein n=1 Tax=Didymodactylos carnosus TaxID=1234261 RepID=A0A8S2KHD5_9BILA|nr:unnamed protein product [Didymodactylos carnosus]CAF3853482.1 unnamed protein product [Didymodactylos carnosus]
MVEHRIIDLLLSWVFYCDHFDVMNRLVLPVLYQPRLARRPVQPRVLRRPAQPRVLRRPVQPRAPRPLPSRLVMTLARPVTYTATATQTTITFALRNDPDYWILDDVSIIQQGTTTELLSNGGFESAMTNWTYCYVTEPFLKKTVTVKMTALGVLGHENFRAF